MNYARVFHYDEEGRLTKIERDFGNGNLQTAYEYGYNSDGAKVWKRDLLNQQEYRYVCRINCGGVPMRVYVRALNETNWIRSEDYLEAGRLLFYDTHSVLSLEMADIYSGQQVTLTDAFGLPVLPQPSPC